MCALLSSGILSARSQDAALGGFESHGDVGSPKLAGSAACDPASQEYTLTGAGTNMWFNSDQFHFLWRKMNGDFILRARIEFVGKGAIAHRKVGWMVRPTLDTGAPYADCARHGDGLTSLQFRRAAGGKTEQIPLTVSNADVLQFERRGNDYIFSAARYGEPFVSAQLTNLDLGDDVYAGLYICSHTADVVEKAVFRDVRIIRPAPEGFVQYRDYIGSVLEILNVHTGKLEQIHQSEPPFEAPIEGGKPTAITPLTPSYFHGWSPDGKFLVYTGGRNDKFDIYKIPSDGGAAETRLTDAPGLNDGPEFTPDGKHIYFNSTRSGTMQVWRMKPDGRDQEQVTNDEFNNWFPHISPDGKWIAFVSYNKDVDPKDHPYYKQIYLRLLPLEGGQPKVIAYVYGGQGTMNAPSWSPDSTRIAFVSNTR